MVDILHDAGGKMPEERRGNFITETEGRDKRAGANEGVYVWQTASHVETRVMSMHGRI